VGIVGFVVARRTREIAIRMAIGAGRHHVRQLVAGEAGLAAIAGLSVGLVVGRWLSTYLESFVYGIEAGSWTTTVAAGVVMCALLIGAALWPARRAVNLSPSAALRVE
jgi:ABC-type antimicrobial peptide transport system permease subunit